MRPKHLPYLLSLTKPASWLNAAGNVDRSACVELRVSEVRRLAGCVEYGWRDGTKWVQSRGTYSQIWSWLQSHELPHEKPARSGNGREATGIFHMDAAYLLGLMRDRMPRRLKGDYRTARAPAMKPGYFRPRPDKRGVLRTPTRFRGKPQGQGAFLDEDDEGLTGNPNRGQSRDKVLAVRDNWQQPLRIEKWRQRKSILPFYYLVCPGPMPWWRADWWAGNRSPQIENWLGEKDPRCAKLSTMPLGTKRKGCPQRVLFLYLPLATQVEYEDAKEAQRWIDSLSPKERMTQREWVHRLAARYGLLFEPRTMVCRRCLGIKYGMNPEYARLKMQRRAAAKQTHGE